MRRKLLLPAAAGIALLTAVPALADPHTITWSVQNPGAGLAGTDGRELPPGTEVRLGYFDLSPAEIEAAFDRPSHLAEYFTETSRERIGNFGGVRNGGAVETTPSNYGTPGAFAQSLTIDLDEMEGFGFGFALNPRFCIWVADQSDASAATAHAIFSSASWTLTLPGLPAAALQWGVENVDPSNEGDLYLAQRGPETSPTVGGLLNLMLPVNRWADDLLDPDENGIVTLLEEAFVVRAAATAPGGAHSALPSMPAPGLLTFLRPPGGTAASWDMYRAGDLEYRIEASHDMNDWRPANALIENAALTSEATSPDAERISVTFATPDGECFLRVRVERVAAPVAPPK